MHWKGRERRMKGGEWWREEREEKMDLKGAGREEEARQKGKDWGEGDAEGKIFAAVKESWKGGNKVWGNPERDETRIRGGHGQPMGEGKESGDMLWIHMKQEWEISLATRGGKRKRREAKQERNIMLCYAGKGWRQERQGETEGGSDKEQRAVEDFLQQGEKACKEHENWKKKWPKQKKRCGEKIRFCQRAEWDWWPWVTQREVSEGVSKQGREWVKERDGKKKKGWLEMILWGVEKVINLMSFNVCF